MKNRNLLPFFLSWLVLLVWASVAAGGAPTFQDLMNPDRFPEAQRGMRVESASYENKSLVVTTSGARMEIDSSGRATFHQLIGHSRKVAFLQFSGGLTGTPEVTQNTPGLAFIRYPKPELDIRANGDSLFMFQAREPIRIAVNRLIDVGFTSSYKSNHLILDEWGGFGMYCSVPDAQDAFDPYGGTTAIYDLMEGDVLWIGICPPKPYDWDRSFHDNVVWHWSNQSAYPPDAELAAWSKEGNIVLLQSEVMLWKDWNMGFEPRLGPEEFARVRKAIHDNGMRFIVYTSPFYFLKRTALEPQAFNSFDGFTNWPPGTPTGENMDLFMPEITKVMKESQPDGLYFDGQYTENPAALYALARETRALLGEDGILEWHSTFALGNAACFLPQADAYVDFILRGEGRDSAYADFDYLRFFVSGYNTSNSIGVLCNNGPKPTRELVARLLRANARMHTIASWLNDPETMQIMHNDYRAKLGDALRREIEESVDHRQRAVAAKARKIAGQHSALKGEPSWGEPILRESFDTVPAWDTYVSPATPDPFSSSNGVLSIKAPAHTYAFLTRPVSAVLKGFVVKIRQGTDGGMSWGPAVCLRWRNGVRLRCGTRSDGKIQCDFDGEQVLIGEHNPAEWIWLRVRWLDRLATIELSRDGKCFEAIRVFDHGGRLTGPIDSLSLGKVPYNGDPIDNPDHGSPGSCDFDELMLY